MQAIGVLRCARALGYQQLINRLNLGLGSAVSILIFFCVILIAVVFTRFLGASPARR